MSGSILGKIKVLWRIKTRPAQSRPKQAIMDVTSLVRRLDQQFRLELESDCNSNQRQRLLVNIALSIRLKSQALKLLNKEGPLALKEVNRFLKKVGFVIKRVGQHHRLHSQPGIIIN